ncbi:MAG TPA: DUF6049 family protein [Actinomycetes bacterium]|nr:DUF6049 family protein [Actinomycetes bacterium]
MTRRPPAGAPSSRARALGLAVLTLLLAVPLTLSPGLPAGHGAGAAPAVAATTPAALRLTSISPDVATAGGVLRVTGGITNTGRQELRDVEVRLRLSATRLGSRAELAAVAEGRTTSRDGDPIATTTLPDLDAGGTTTFAVSRALDEIPQLTGFGVYVLGVEVLAGRPSGFGRVAMVRTMLPWVPEQPDFLPTGYTWLWPLVSRPTRLSDGTFSDDVLAGEMSADGRLGRLLDAGTRIQDAAALTWVIDPELLSAAADMADGYRVQAPDGSTVPGGGSGIAGLWLDRLRTVTAGQQVLPLPYADPDLVALNRHGRAGDIVRADASAEATFADVLPLAGPVSDIAWPINGFVNRSTLGVLRGDGRTAAVLDGRAVPPEIDLSYTPAGRADLATRSGKVAGLLADPGLADQLRRHGPDPLLAGQRVLAETAMITSELPSTGTERSIVVMPPRRWDPEQAFLDRLVATADAPWTAAVPLRMLAQTAPPEIDRQPLDYPSVQRRLELPGLYLRALDAMHTSISLLRAILTDPAQLVPELERSVNLLESSWWRGRPSRVNRLDREKDLLTEARTSVRVQPGNFTFSSRSGTIPVTVANELDQEVEVVLRLDPQTPRLRVDPVEAFTIGPKSKRQIPVSASAVASGPVVVDAQLHTPGGAAYGQPVPLQISITQYGTVALYITAVAAGVLFLAAGVRVLRRVVSARREEPDPPTVADQAEVTEPVP